MDLNTAKLMKGREVGGEVQGRDMRRSNIKGGEWLVKIQKTGISKTDAGWVWREGGAQRKCNANK